MKVAIIGAGPAGMTAAIAAADNGHEVTVFEKNEKTGKKLYITGKGRCNLTNASDCENIIKNTVTNPKFLYSALKKFGSEDTVSMMNGVGLELKTERGNRVFPVSDKSSDVINAFNKLLQERNVTVRLNEGVKSLLVSDNKIVEIVTEKGTYSDFSACIVATGGVSYPATGSTGDGYRFSAECGHTIVEPKPSLVGIYANKVGSSDKKLDLSTYKLQGISLKNVAIKAVVNGKTAAEDFGEALFTDKGISGPIVLTLSAFLNRYPMDKAELILDMKPALSAEQLHERILRESAENANKDLKNYLRGFLPAGLVSLFLDVCSLPAEKKVNSLSKTDRIKFVDCLKGLRFSDLSLEPIERAVVTSGGVAVSEVDAKTMRSKLIDNLYFAGEVLDVDALTGGYNIQIAMSTGYAAGSQL